MNRAISLLLFLLATPLAAQEAAPPPVSITYTLEVTKPKSGAEGEARVEMLVDHNRDDEITLGIPVWMPGRYRVVSHYLGIKELEAEIEGKKVEVAVTDHKSLWKLKTGGAKRFTVRYALKPHDVPQLRGNLTEDHFFIHGPTAWLF